jgi:valyl-tRNA synthetase
VVYRFVWNLTCDWYLELTKPVLMGPDAPQKAETRAMVAWVLDTMIALLHPFMPFITEEIWQKLGGVEPSIMVAPYPIAEELLEDPEAERLIEAVQAMITTVRNARAERGFTPKDRFKLHVRADAPRDAKFFADHAYLLIEMARLTEVIVNGDVPEGAHHDVVAGFAIAVEFPERVITKEQMERTQRELEKSRKELEGVTARLANEQFVRNAPPAVVEQARARQTELRARIEKLMQNQQD